MNNLHAPNPCMTVDPIDLVWTWGGRRGREVLEMAIIVIAVYTEDSEQSSSIQRQAEWTLTSSLLVVAGAWRSRLVDHVARASRLQLLLCFRASSPASRLLPTLIPPPVPLGLVSPSDDLESPSVLAHVLPDSFRKCLCWLSSPWLHITIRPRLLVTPITASPAPMTMAPMTLLKRNWVLVPLVPGPLLQVLRNVAVGNLIVPF